ncbi:exoenzymes regulatory protein aepA precursor, putative [Talaromyces stipitatus ATCC 10500]|uniref:Exoenzymes regulatory protein aepA, putative n=1 Tax=Talaromyces stipitatus (strain ATCC 10500 / CBS 375.48 / QM 6759 / NRRL 1006) TaxID=441959 RepID=B8MJW3_TALSN|nr:exoenzymes regulatory protein aepA precursor, putative [Talaromyces stipitatus ATCC 10500]EED14780.1 exoenzymes regulatory protein aepA precursor, putative [Talaromyces stipitatus ATCC 10500]
MTTVIEQSVAYYNGKVYTLNGSGQLAEAFIVTLQGTFAMVGTSDEVLQFAKAHGIITYNLHGRFVMPGIHDAHVHLLSAGVSYLSGVNLACDTTIENIGMRIQEGQCACAYQHAFQDWVVGNISTIPDFDRASLDKYFPDTPIMIQGGAGHSAFLNTAGLRKAGYDVDNEPDVNGAKFGRHPDGSLTEELGELAMNKAMLAKGNSNVAHTKRAITEAIQRLQRVGVTSCQEAATNTVILHALRELDRDNALKLDIAAHSVYAPEFLANERQSSLKALIDQAPKLATKHVRTSFVKILLDGLPPLFSSAGIDSDGNIELDKILVGDVVEVVKQSDQRGMTVKLHATGRGSTRLAFEAIAAARKANTKNGTIRHEIAHCNGIHPDDLQRFKKHGVTAELSPAMFFDHPLTQANKETMNWDITDNIITRESTIAVEKCTSPDANADFDVICCGKIKTHSQPVATEDEPDCEV